MPVDKRTLLALSGVALGVGLLGGGYTLYRKTLRPPRAWPTPPASASIAPALEELGSKHPQLKKLAEDPKVGSVIKEFAEAYSSGGIEKAKTFARERGFMNGADDITLTVLTENDETAELEASLQELKAQIVGRGDSQIDVQVPWSVVEEEARSGRPPEQLIEKVANLKNVRGVLPMERPEKNQSPFGSNRPADGVRATRADRWHAAGFKGAGIKVGVLDPEISKSSRFLGTVLPKNTPVFLGGCVNAQGNSIDDEGLHGPAAAEIVHAMAPDAQLYLACSLGNDDAAIQWLVNQGVKIISYSAGGIYGRRNGTGRSQDRINRLARQGILWVNAAGNDGRTFHRGQLAGVQGWHSFASGKTAMGFRTKTVDGSIKVTLIWHQWDNALISDYDLHLFDASMKEIGRSTNRNTTIRQPMETVSARLRPGQQYYVGIRGNNGVKATSFILNIHNAGSIEFLNPSGSLGQPADAAGALAVGAVSWNSSKVTAYSSRGPTEDGRLKPEISAPTEVSSVVYKGNFAGTSAAAPHVSGAAALVWSRFPQYSRDQVVQFLLSRSRDLGSPGPDNDYGHGYLDMGDPGQAVAAVPTPLPTPTLAPPSTRPTSTPTSTPTSAPPSTPVAPDEDEDSDGSSAFRTVLAVLALMAIGGLVLVGGLVYLAISLLRGSRRAPQRPVGSYIPPTPPPGPVAPSFQPPYQPAPPSPQRPPGGFVPGGTVVPQGQGWTGLLVVVSGPAAGTQLPLRPGVISIGRSPGNQLMLADPMVSSRHATLRTDEQGCWLEDAGARNGLFVNGQRIQRHFLRPGDVITVGPAQIRFDVVAG
ncbi:MAG: S8 family serine peptidase [Polyangiaceae bacterium]|jgi:subtilisin family serine protease|nr:S8 family serine peptidase [Polyangiaceae bacterium]